MILQQEAPNFLWFPLKTWLVTHQHHMFQHIRRNIKGMIEYCMLTTHLIAGEMFCRYIFYVQRGCLWTRYVGWTFCVIMILCGRKRLFFSKWCSYKDGPIPSITIQVYVWLLSYLMQYMDMKCPWYSWKSDLSSVYYLCK